MNTYLAKWFRNKLRTNDSVKDIRFCAKSKFGLVNRGDPLNAGSTAPFVFLSAAARALGVAANLSGSGKCRILAAPSHRTHRTRFRSLGSRLSALPGCRLLAHYQVEQ